MKSASGKPSTDAKIIRAFMTSQPRSLESLETATGVARETLRKRLVVLVKMNVAKETSGGWAFSNYNPLEETVREAMEQLLEWGSRQQSTVMIANMINQLYPDLVGANPKEVAPIAWHLSSELKIAINEDLPFTELRRRVF